jgi:hypothetical protein
MAEKLAAGAKQVARGVQALLAPDLKEIKGELRGIHSQIESTNVSLTAKMEAANTRIDEMDRRHAVQFEALRNELRGLSEKIDIQIRGLAEKVDYAPRIAVIEEKLRELEKQAK